MWLCGVRYVKNSFGNQLGEQEHAKMVDGVTFYVQIYKPAKRSASLLTSSIYSLSLGAKGPVLETAKYPTMAIRVPN